MARKRDSKGRFTSDQKQVINSQAPTFNRELAYLIANARSMRDELFNKINDPRRDIGDECGYADNPTVHLYKEMFDRNPIAARVVDVLPTESWMTSPTVFEDEDPETVTAFEESWSNIAKLITPDTYYKQEEGNPLWEYLKRVDQLSGVGTFGLLLLGFNDGEELREEVTPAEGMEIIYIRAFDEDQIDIVEYDVDPTSYRFGKPIAYNIKLHDPESSDQGGIGLDVRTERVHWTRVIHVADNLTNSEIFGVPRMKPVYNRLYDLEKLYAGSAEMYWRGAFPGISLESHPQLGADIELSSAEVDTIKSAMENYHNGLQRYLLNLGLTAKSLAPQVVDPSPQIDKHIEAVCIQLGIPKRIFMGSERGELSSSQDEGTWNDRLAFRQNYHITPRIIVPTIDRLIWAGVLSPPVDGYSVVWPDFNSITEAEKAEIAVKKTEALAKYLGGQVHTLLSPASYLTTVLDMTVSEAEAVLEAAMRDTTIEDQFDEQEATTEGTDTDQTPPTEEAGQREDPRESTQPSEQAE